MKEMSTLAERPLSPGGEKKNLAFFLTGAILTFILFYTGMTVLPLLVYDLGGTELDTGVQTTIYYIASILMRFYFGPLSDKKGRKLPILIGTFAFALSFLLFYFCDSVFEVTLARIVHAVGLAAFFSSSGSLIVDLAPPARLGFYVGIFRMTFVFALLSGPTLALAIIQKYSMGAWSLTAFFIGLAALFLLTLIKAPPLVQEGEGEEKGEGAGSFEKFKLVLEEKATHQIYLGILLCTFAYGAILIFGLLFINRNFEIENPGLYFTIFSIVGLAANLLSGYLSDRIGRRILVWPAIFLLSAGVGVLYFAPALPALLWVSSILGGLGYFGGMASLAAWLMAVAPREHRGTAVALQESIFDFSVGASTFIFGLLSARTGMGGAFLIIGLAVAFFALVNIFFGHKKQSEVIS